MTSDLDKPEAAVHGGLSPAAIASVLQSIAALRNRRALAAMLGSLVACVLVAGIVSTFSGRLGVAMTLFGFVAMAVAAATGINAAGVLLHEQARGMPLRPLPDALVHGFKCVPKVALLASSLLLTGLAVFVVLAIAYAICRMPVLGPILFVVVFPLSVVVSGLTVCGLLLGMWLALPAIWEGASVSRAITQALAIMRGRPIETTALLAVAGLLAGVVGILVFGVLFSGLVPAVGLAAAVFGEQGFGWMAGMARAGGETGDVYGERGGYGLAAGVGGGLLWALAGSLSTIVYLLGLNIVYLRVVSGLDIGAAEAAIGAHLDAAKRRVGAFGRKARAAAAAATKKPAGPPPAPPPQALAPNVRVAPPESTTPAVAKALTCQHCLSAVGNDDRFCAVCGFRLK